MWANEQESAALSGYSVEGFKKALPTLEATGFPKNMPLNGLRFIPAILNFWAGQIDSFKNSDLESTTMNIRDYED
jgi:hypothetical protein